MELRLHFPPPLIIQGDSLARGSKLLSIKNYVNQLTDDELTTGYYRQDGATCHTSNASMREIGRFFSRQNYLKKPLATQISRSNACRLLSLGPTEGQSVYKNTFRTVERLNDAIRQEIQAANVDTLGKVFQNLEKRIQVCLDVKGDQFQHRL